MTTCIDQVYTYEVIDILPDPLEFEWDKGNIDKNFRKHKVSNEEAEQVFLSDSVFFSLDIKHSTTKEKRYLALGKTDKNKQLFISFTIKDKIRIISARPMSKKERREYDKKTQTNSKI